jgi:hypothetical protein
MYRHDRQVASPIFSYYSIRTLGSSFVSERGLSPI